MYSRSHRVGISLGALVVLLSACQGDAEEADDSPPDPVPPEELESVDLPADDLDELVEVMEEQMGAAQTVGVDVSTEPEAEEAEPLEQVTVQLRLGDPPEALMTIVESDKETPTTTEVVVIDGVVYSSLEGEELAEGKPWVRLSREDIDAAQEELGMFAEVFTVMLDEVEASLEQAAGDQAFEVVRHGELTEEPEPHEEDSSWTFYQGRTSTGELADAEDDSIQELSEQGLDTIHWTLAVSEEGLPREHSIQMLTPDGEDATVTAAYSDWGQQVDVQKPAEDETATIEETLE